MESQNKRSKSIAILIAAILLLVAIPFAWAKYVERVSVQNKALNFNEYRIGQNEVALSPEGYTGGSVTITITPDILDDANEGKTGSDQMKIQYKLGGAGSTWTDYTGPFSVDENQTITARLVSPNDENFVGPETQIEVNNIAVARVTVGSGSQAVTTTYKTLAEAIAACPENAGNTTTLIEMLADTNESVTVPAGKNIILNLEGNKITGQSGSSSATAITVNGTLNLIDSGKSSGGSQTYGSVTVKNPNSTTSPAAIEVGSTGTLTLGTSESQSSQTEVVNTNSPVVDGGNVGIKVDENGTLNFYDGRISGKTQAIDDDNVTGTATINDDVNTPDTWVVDVNIDSQVGREVATLIKTYTVSFNSNGGTPSAISDIIVAPGKTYGALDTWPSDPTKTGYTFGGWNGKDLFDENRILLAIPGAEYKNGHYEFSTPQAHVAYGGITGTAYCGNKQMNISYKENTQYTLTIKGGSEYIESANRYCTMYFGFFYTDGTKSMKTISGENTYILTSLANKTIETISFSYGIGGKSYIEYVQLEEGTSSTAYEAYAVTTSTIVTQEKDHTLTAIWNANQYTVTYNANTGSGSIQNTVTTYDTNIVLPDTTAGITKTGYILKGWSTDPNAVTPTYTPGQTVSNLTATDGATVTLYAIWADETAPTNAAPTGTSTTSTITVQCNQQDEGSGIDSSSVQYAIKKDLNNDGVIGPDEWSEWQSSPAFTGLQANTQYEVKTRASDNDGNGPTESQVGTITTSQIQNGEIEVYKASDTTTPAGKVTPNDDPTDRTNPVNEDIVIKVDSSDNGTTTVVVKKYPNGTPTTYPNGSTTPDAQGNYDINVSTETGVYEITVTTTDGTNTVEETIYIFVDKTAPTTVPDVDESSNSITVDADAQDTDSGIETITYTLKDDQGNPARDKDGNVVAPVVVTGNNSQEVTFTNLPDGTEFYVEIVVVDKAGNTTTTTEQAETDDLTPGSLAFKEATSEDTFSPATVAPSGNNKVWQNENVVITPTAGSAGTTTFTVTKVGDSNPQGPYSNQTEISTTDGDYVVTLTTTDGVNTETLTYYFSIDKTRPTVAIAPNGDTLTIAVGNTTANIQTTFTATDNNGGSGIATTKYGVSTSSIVEPSAYADFVSGTQITQTKTGGVYYLWTKVIDNAGNEATSIKVSNAFDIGYTIEYDRNTGSAQDETITSKRKTAGENISLQITEPTRNMYVFKGWSENSSATTATYSNDAVYSEDRSMRLYAVWSEVVASTTIGQTTTYHDSVQGAIDAASTSTATVTILKDNISEDVSVAAGQNITIDLNNMHWSNDGTTDNIITNRGTLVITDTTVTQNNTAGELNSTKRAVYNLGTLTVDGKVGVNGTVNGGVSLTTILNNGTLNVNNGLITSTSNSAISNTSTGTVVVNAGSITGAVGIINNSQSTGTIIVNGGSINTSGHGIRNYIGNVEFNNGNIQTGLWGDGIWTSSTGNVSVTGGTITGGTNGVVTTGTGRITITGGTIEAKSTSNSGNAVNSHGKLTIGNNNDANIATTQTPVLIGSIKGVVNTGSEFNFYDGIIKAPSGQTIIGTVTATPEGYRVINGTEVIDGTTYETAYLDNHYDVTYSYNGATSGNTETGKTVEYGTAYGTLPAPERTGYTFSGWFLNSTEVTAQTVVSTASNHTLQAHWTANANTAYTVVHYLQNANDNNYTVVETETLHGTTDTTVLASTLTKAGTTNLPSSTYEGAKTAGGETTTQVTILPDGSGEIHLYYTRNTFTMLVIDGTNTKNPSGSGTYRWGQTVNISAEYKGEAGYSYSNFRWSANPAATVIADSTAQSTTATMPQESTTITALADKAVINYTLNFDTNGGTFPQGTTVPNSYTVEDTVNLPEPEKQGYVFVGWKEVGADDSTATTEIPAGTIGNKNYVALYNNGEVSFRINHYLENANDNNYTLYSTEVIDTYKGTSTKVKTGDVVTLDNNLAITIANSTYVKSTDTLGGNQGTSVTVAADGSTQIYVYYNRNTYALTVTAGTHTTNAQGSGTYKWGESVDISAAYANLNGYTYSNFAWTTADTSILESTTDQTTTVTMPAAATTVTSTATRAINTYTISYTLDGGTVSGTNPTSYTVEDNNITLINPTKTGYTFAGWTGTGLSGATQNVVISTGSYGNRSYTATWQINSYTVTYDYGTNGGQISSSNAGTTSTAQVNYNSAIDLSKTAYKANYTLVGWNTDQNATTGLSSLTMGTSNVTLYAIYSKPVTVTFDKNGGNANVTSNYTMYNTNTSLSITTPEPTTFSGWTFNGYAETNNATSGTLANQTITKTVAQNTTSVTYYHTWKKTISFNSNKPATAESTYDVTLNEQNREIYYNNEFGTLPANPSLQGWQFDGWFTAASGGTQITAATMAQNVPDTIYAHWSLAATMNVSPASATLDLSDNNTQQITVTGSNYGTVTYVSSDPTKATVSNTGLITAVSNTSTPVTITVTGSNGNIIRTITIDVVTSPTEIDVTPKTALIGVNAGNTVQLSYALHAYDSNEQEIPVNANNTVTWSSSDTSVATVNASTGVVTGVSNGTATITATTANGCTDTATVTVDSIAPTVATSVDNGSYKRTHTVTITLTDDVAGMPASQDIQYAWSTSATTAPTSWSTTTLTATQGDTSASTTLSRSSGTGTYYLWVKAGSMDRFENATSANYVNSSAKVYMDRTAPVIAMNGSANLSKANPNSSIIIPLKITEKHSGMNTGSTADAFTADDIVVKVNGTTVTPTTKTLTYNSVSSGVYSYSLTLEGITGTGDLTLEIASGKVKDKATNSNAATTLDTGVDMDETAFTCTITASETSPTNASQITYTFTFNKEPLNGSFTQSDISVTNGTITSFTKVSDTVYTAIVTNTGSCTQSVDVITGSVEDTSGNTLEDVTAFSMLIDRTNPTNTAVSVKAGNVTKGTVNAGTSGTVYTGSVNNTLHFLADDLETSVVGYKVATSADADFASLPTVSSQDIQATTAGTTYYVKAVDEVGNLSTNPTVVTVKLVTLSVSPAALSVENEKTGTLTATAVNAGTVQWSSSDTSIATVAQDGTVTAHKVGTVTITATASNDTSVTATSQVTVTKGIVQIPDAVTGLVYNAQNQTGVVIDSTHCNVSGNTATNAGSYTATVSLKDTTNYQWSDGTTTNKSISWEIAQKPVTVTVTASNKTYDGTTNVIGATYSISGVETGDTVSATGTAAYASATAGNNKTINVTGITLSGADSANYIANTTATTSSNITKASLTVTYTGETITYGETPDLSMNKISVSGFVNSETTANAAGWVDPTITAPDLSAGNHTVTPVGPAEIDNYTITYQGGTLAILAKNLSSQDIVATLSQDTYTYNGQFRTPTVTVTDGGNALALNTDYQVAYSDNKNYGTATVTITGTGNYTGTIILHFDIERAVLTATYTGDNVIYNRTSPSLTVTVTGFVNGETAATASGYVAPTVSNVPTAVGSYTLYPSGGAANNYSFNYVSGVLSISAPSVEDITATLSQSSYDYDGTAKEPGVTVYDGEDELVEGTDYDVAYNNNVDAGTATATITLKGNYSGVIYRNYTINKINMSGSVAITGWTYGDSANTPTTTITTATVDDYSVTYSYSGLTNAGVTYGPSASAPTQAGNYTVTATVVDNDDNHNNLVTSTEFTIARATLIPTATANNKNYDGTTAGTGRITLAGAKYTDNPTATATFTFTSANSNNNTAQTVNVTNITLDSGFTANYTVSPTSLTTQATIYRVAGTISNLEMDDYTYGETPSTPVVESSTNDTTNPTYSYSGTTYGGVTYGPSSTAPTEAGEYTLQVTLPANGNYNELTSTVNFTVNKATVTPVIAVSNKTYNGNRTVTVSSQQLTGVLNDDDVSLVIGTAPTFPSKDVGTYTVTAGNLSLSGTKASNYELSTTSVSLQAKINKKQLTATYQGETITYGQSPDLTRITVTGFISGESAANAASYVAPTVTNSNTAVGTYSLTPAGGSAKNYKFKYVAGNLVINAKSIEDNNVTATLAQSTYTYNGTAREPGVTVVDSSVSPAVTLTEGTDYTVTYSNNTNAGTATVTIEGAGNYSGTVVLNFTIQKVTLTTTAVSDAKTYDGTTSATGTASVTGGVNSEVPTLKDTTTFTFATATAGTGKTVYVAGLELDDAWKTNYQINAPTMTLTNGIINKAVLTASYAGETVEFGTSPALTVNYSGFISGEGVGDLTTAPTITNNNTALGSYVLTPAGGVADNYSFNYVSGTLTIIRKIANVTVTLSDTEYTFDGTPKTPTVTVVDNSTGNTLTLGTDYTVSYLNNTNAGTATAVVEMIGNFDGEAREDFTILQAPMNASVSISGWTYGSSANAPSVSASAIAPDTTQNISISATYSYSGTTNAGTTYGPTTTAPTQAGSYTVTATIVDNDGNHITSVETANFTIDKLQVAVPTANTNLTYNGSSQTGVTRVGTNYTISGNTGTNAGNYTATVTLSNTNNYRWQGLADGVAQATIPWSIGKVTLTPTVTAQNKVYDGTTDVTSASISLAGAVNSETPTATASYAFNSANVGTRTVTASNITLTGGWGTNYELSTTTATTTAQITAKAMTVSPVSSYSGTYDGAAHGITVNVTEPGVAGTDYEVYYATTPLTSSNYNTAGSTTPVTRTDAGTTTVYYYVKDLTGNYSDYASNANSNNGTISISKVVLTPSVASVASKTYDRTTNGSGTISLAGAVNGENPTATATFKFANKNAGTGKTVNITNIALTGSWSTNYELSTTSLTSTSGVINKKQITATLNADDKDYDGTTAATGSISLSGVISGDTVTASAASYTFDNKNAGSRTVTASTLTLAGADRANYKLSTAQASSITGSATINKLPLTISSITAQSKTYDGTTSTSGTITLQGAISGESPTATGTFNFANKNAGNNKTVNVTNIALGSTWTTNYTLAATTGTATANINKKKLTATYASEEVVYGHTPAYTVNVTGFISGESASNAAGYTAPSVTPVSNPTVSGSPYTLTPQGGAATNYSFTYVQGTLTITPDSSNTPVVTVSPTTYVYDGTAKEPAVTVTYGGVTLVENTDYTVQYSNNTNVGTATAAVTLIGNYEGTGSTTYTITKADGTASVTMAGWTYGDSASSPVPTSATNGTSNVTYEYYTDANCTNKTATSDGASSAGAKPSKAGTYYVKATFAQTQNYKAVSAIASFTIAQKEVTVQSATANAKTYNGNTNGSGSITLAGGVNGETPTATGTFTYDNKNVGTGKTVTISNITLNSAYSRNYVLSSNQYTLNNGVINKKQLTATYVSETITYGGTPALAVNITGFVSGENASNAAGYRAPTVTNSNTSVGAYSLTPAGGTANNYSFNYVSGTLTINASNSVSVALTLPDGGYVYDGTAKEPAVTVTDTVTGETIPSSEYTVTYSNNVNAGNNTAVVTVTFKNGQNHTGSYSENFSISKADMDVTVTNYSGTYDRYTHTITLSNIPSNDVTIYYATYSTTILPGSGTTTKPTRKSKGTTNVYYYIVDNTGNYNDYDSKAHSNNGLIKINAKQITAVASANDKIYDGTTTGSGSISLTGVISGDTVTATASSYTFDNKNAGNRTVTASGITLGGANASNYTLASTTATTSATISKRALVPDTTPSNKVYDGTTAGTGSAVTVTNAVSGESPVVTATYAFDTACVGNNKNVTINYTLNSSWTTNYNLSKSSETKTANITPATLTVTYAGETIAYGETPSLTLVVTGFVNGESASTAHNYTAPTLTTSASSAGTYTIANGGLTYTAGYAEDYVFAETISALNINASNNVSITVNVPQGGYFYDGTAKTPTVTVTDTQTGETINSSEYDVSYSNNINAGTNTATVTVTFKNGQNHTGTFSENFTIQKGTRTISNVATQYVGKGSTKDVTFTYNGTEDATATVSSGDAKDVIWESQNINRCRCR